MTERLYPSDAPFVAGTVPSGWFAPMTQAEADEANALYPVPPYGNTYWPPGTEPPPLGSSLQFVRLTDIESDGTNSWANLSPEDADKLEGKDTITVWPIAGRAGVLDDLPARAVRINGHQPGRIKINLETDGLNIAGLVLLGVVYDPA